MKKLYKYVLSLLLVFAVFVVCSCNQAVTPTITSVTTTSETKVSFSKNLNAYNENAVDEDSGVSVGIQMFSNFEYENGHVLEVVFNLRFFNNNSYKAKLDFSNAKAYGNDELLTEKVYEDYDPEHKDQSKLFDTKVLTVDGNGSAQFSFSLVIPDGNQDAKLRADFTLNNVTLSVHNYAHGYVPTKFIYVHNPSLNSAVLADAEYDANAVYGYKPNTTGSLKQYTTYDWTKKDDVLQYKEERIKYIEENDAKIKALEKSMKAEGKSIEEVARACSSLRNQIRLDQYKNDPEGLAKLKARNLEKYGHEEGPLPDELYVKYNNSWETVLEKCYSPNKGMDACCGVYDMYYYLT